MKQNSFTQRSCSNENRNKINSISQQDEENEQKIHFKKNFCYQNHQIFQQQEDSTSNAISTANQRASKNINHILKQITHATVISHQDTNSNRTSTDKEQKIQEKLLSMQQMKEKDDDDLRLQRLRKNSIVSIYCKQNDITFVSSPEEFTLKVLNNTNPDEENPHLSQLQIEMIIHKEGEEESKQKHQQSNIVCQKRSQTKNEENLKYNGNRESQKTNKENKNMYDELCSMESQNNRNASSEVENDDEYDILELSPSSNSLEKAIQEHTSLLIKYENNEEKNEQSINKSSSTISAYDLLLSLQQDLMKY